MEMIEYLQTFLETDNKFIIFLLTLILAAGTIDFFFGWINAKFNKNVDFESCVALHGIIKKVQYFIVLAFFIPVSVIVPSQIGTTALITLYTGFLISEVNSILSHLELTNDGKKGEMLKTFVLRFFEKGED